MATDKVYMDITTKLLWSNDDLPLAIIKKIQETDPKRFEEMVSLARSAEFEDQPQAVLEYIFPFNDVNYSFSEGSMSREEEIMKRIIEWMMVFNDDFNKVYWKYYWNE